MKNPKKEVEIKTKKTIKTKNNIIEEKKISKQKKSDNSKKIDNENKKEKLENLKKSNKETTKKKKKKRKLKKKPVIILLLSILLIGLSIGGFFVAKKLINKNNKDNLIIELNGENVVSIKYNSEYEDLGAKAFFKEQDLTSEIEVSNNLDIKKVGEYTYTYSIEHNGIKKEITRTINVIDDDNPSIQLNGREDISIVLGKEYKEYGASASDLYDGDLTNNIEINKDNLNINKAGTYEVKYIVKDSSGNTSETSRVVNVVEKAATKVPVLNYHFFYVDKSDGCNQGICLRLDRFKEQLNYLRDNGFYTVTMQEFVDWMYGEIELPEKSVLITVDDGAWGTGTHNGNYLIPTLEEYKMYATLFLITGWWPKENYQSHYLELQSHTDNLHYEGIKGCSHRSKVNCISYEDLIADLKQSIAVLGNTNSFCFPFYDYTETSIKAVKEVGFKVAFIGGGRKATRSDDKYKIPRYAIQGDTSLSSFKSIVN